MGEMKFASTEDAIQHLSNITDKRVKIAWQDEGREMMKLVADSIRKKPGLMSALKKNKVLNLDKALQDAGLDADAKILPTNKGSMKIVQEVPKEMIESVAARVEGIKDLARRGKVIDYVSEDKAFDDFHAKYPKGIQKDDNGPYYRAKGGLLSRGLDKVMGEKGEGGEKDTADTKAKEDATKAEKDRVKKNMSDLTSQLSKKTKSFSETISKDEFELLLKDPANADHQKEFIDAFKKDIADKKIGKDEAGKYLQMAERMAKRAEKEFGDELPKLSESLKELAKDIDTAEDKAPEEAQVISAPPEGDSDASPILDAQGNPMKRSSEEDSVINNIIDEWLAIKNV